MRHFLVIALSLAMAQSLSAGPLDDRRRSSAQQGGDSARTSQNRTSRISMLFEGRVIGLVALKSLDGDIAQFTISRGEPIKVPWASLPAVVQNAFADDRLILLAARGASIEQALKNMGAEGLAGRIVQKVPDGVLVRLSAPNPKTSYMLYSGHNPTKISGQKLDAAGPEGQLIIIQNLPNEEILAYDDTISVVGFPAGTWQYGQQTLPAYAPAPLAAK
jgi:hypothetical protein